MLKTEMKMTPQNAGFWQNRKISRQNTLPANIAFQTALPRIIFAAVFVGLRRDGVSAPDLRAESPWSLDPSHISRELAVCVPKARDH